MRQLLSPTEIKARIIEKAITWIPHHDCGMCGYVVGYRIDGERVMFDPSCDCTPRSYLDHSSFADLAEWYGMQNNDTARLSIGSKYGFTEEELEWKPKTEGR